MHCKMLKDRVSSVVLRLGAKKKGAVVRALFKRRLFNQAPVTSSLVQIQSSDASSMGSKSFPQLWLHSGQQLAWKHCCRLRTDTRVDPSFFDSFSDVEPADLLSGRRNSLPAFLYAWDCRPSLRLMLMAKAKTLRTASQELVPRELDSLQIAGCTCRQRNHQ